MLLLNLEHDLVDMAARPVGTGYVPIYMMHMTELTRRSTRVGGLG